MHELKYPPRQFNFRREWLTRVWSFFKTPAGAAALELLGDKYLEIAEFKHECTSEFCPDYADEVLELDRVKARVCVKDLDWLRKTFDGIDLAPFLLRLAKALFPEERWTIEESDEFAVVVNKRRSLVLDLKNFDLLSANASLHLAGVPGMESAREEVEAHFEAKRAIEEGRMKKVSALVDQFGGCEEVIPIGTSRSTSPRE